MEAWFEKNSFESDFPFDLFINVGRCQIIPHWHEEIEIIYILKGGVSVGINSRLYDLKEKDILIISGGDIHSFLPASDDSQRLVLRFNLSVFDGVPSVTKDRKEIKPLFDYARKHSVLWTPEAGEEMRWHIHKIFDEYSQRQKGYKLAIKAMLYELAVFLLRKVPMEERSKVEVGRRKEAMNRLESVFSFVENNYSSDISLTACAEEAGFSVYHFTRFFKQHTGMTFNQYLSSFRITQAEWLLMNEDKNITEVALQCGFNNVKTFERVFKIHKGEAPSQFKKRQKMRTNEQ